MPRRHCARNVPTGNAGSKVLVAVLTALGERDGAVRDTERRAGDALQTMTSEEGLSLRQAVEWWGSGALTVREVSRLRQLARDPPGGSGGATLPVPPLADNP